MISRDPPTLSLRVPRPKEIEVRIHATADTEPCTEGSEGGKAQPGDLHRRLSADGHPEFRSLKALRDALGFHLSVEQRPGT